jgi:Flp pilus assembly protein TadG
MRLLFRPAAPAPPRRHGRVTPRHGGAEAAPAAPRRTRRWDDRGVSMLEFAGFLPVLLVIGMAAIQLGLVGYAVSQAGSGARAAARAASQHGGDGAAAGRAAVSGWLNPRPDVRQGADTTTATVTVHVPAVIPLFGGWDVSRHATMPDDD